MRRCLGEPECDLSDRSHGIIYHAGWCPRWVKTPNGTGVERRPDWAFRIFWSAYLVLVACLVYLVARSMT